MVAAELYKDFQISITKALAKQLIQKYGEGSAAALKEISKKVGKEEIEALPVSKQAQKKAIVDVLAPIGVWNAGLAKSMEETIKGYIESGFSPKQISNALQGGLAEKLESEVITIRRPGKQQYSMRAGDYIRLISRTVPMYARNAGYIDRMKRSEKFLGWRSICAADERSCPECVRKMEESLQSPFSWDVPHPPYHPNCRCRPVGVVSEDDVPPIAEGSEEERQIIEEIINPKEDTQIILPQKTVEDPQKIWEEAGIYPFYSQSYIYECSLKYRKEFFVKPIGGVVGEFVKLPNRGILQNVYLPERGDDPEKRFPRLFVRDLQESPFTYLLTNCMDVYGYMHKDTAFFPSLLIYKYDEKLFGEKGCVGPRGAKKFKKIFGLSDDQFKQIEQELRYATLKIMMGTQTGGVTDYDVTKRIVEQNDKLIKVDPEVIKNFRMAYELTVKKRLEELADKPRTPFESVDPFKYHTDIILRVLDDMPCPPVGRSILAAPDTVLRLSMADYDTVYNICTYSKFRESCEELMGRRFTHEELHQIGHYVQKQWLKNYEKTDGFRLDPSASVDYSEQFWLGLTAVYADPVGSAKNMPEFTSLIINNVKNGIFADDKDVKLMFGGTPAIDLPRWKGKVEQLEPTRTIVNEFANRVQDTDRLLEIVKEYAKKFNPENKRLQAEPVKIEEGKVEGYMGYTRIDGSGIVIKEEILKEYPRTGFGTIMHEFAHFQSIYMPDPKDGKPRMRFIDTYGKPSDRLLLHNFGVFEDDPGLRETIKSELRDVLAYVRAGVQTEKSWEGQEGMYKLLQTMDRVQDLNKKDWWKNLVDPWTGKKYPDLEDAMRGEVIRVAMTNPQIFRLMDLKSISSPAFQPPGGKYFIGIQEAGNYFSRFFPPDYDVEIRDDIIAYFTSQALQNGINLARADKDWAASREEWWAVFNEGLILDPATVKALAPTAYKLYLKGLDSGLYSPAFKEILGYKAETPTAVSMPPVDPNTVQSFTKMFSAKRNEDTVKAVSVYRSDKYRDINSYLRGERAVTEEERKEIIEVVRKLEEAAEPTPVSIKVFRGFCHPDIPDDLDRIKGGVLTDRGVVSTSFDEEVANKYAQEAAKKLGGKPVVAEIVIPEGQKVVYADGILGREIDKEIILPPGQQFRIIDAFIDKNGVRRLIMTLASGIHLI